MTSAIKPCLCIVFNHAYTANIPILERIYRDRFPLMKYIVPFETVENNPDVITVYRGSYNHQGFVTDAAYKLRDIDCTHFIFLQDDVLLSPSLDAASLFDTLRIGRHGGFVTNLGSINMDIGAWHWIPGIVWKLFYPRNLLSGTGVDSTHEILRHLPPIDEALKKFARQGIELPVVTRSEESFGEKSVVKGQPYFGTTRTDLIDAMNNVVVESLFDTAKDKNRIEFPYPFAMTAWGADFFVLPASALERYRHICGVLAAANVFAEIAVGTALILTVDDLVTSATSGAKFEWEWSADRMDLSSKLIAKFSDPEVIAVHPIKLSHLGHTPGAIDAILKLSDRSAH